MLSGGWRGLAKNGCDQVGGHWDAMGQLKKCEIKHRQRSYLER